ncbi:MAG: DUF4848 domain-containing protein [Bacteroidia bacterium]|nr:DUF4848 domain-containing protein [Bacteroidia bacterium]
MKKSKVLIKCVFMAIVISLSMVSCDQSEIGVETPQETTNIMGTKLDLVNKTLSFDNEQSLKNLLSEIKKIGFSTTRSSSTGSSTELLQLDGFHSLYDTYVDAMLNAESYYDREGGYEEFKKKYSSLYFPEHEDDFSAYLPVSDPMLAHLLNNNGEVIIAGKTVNMKDVFSYKQLEELGLTPPEEEISVSKESSISNTRAGNLYYPGTPVVLELKKRMTYNNRRIWFDHFTLGVRGNTPQLSAGLEICFRKKGFLGAWYNHWALTKATVGVGGFRLVDNVTKDGPSSHNHMFDIPGRALVVKDLFRPGEPPMFEKHIYGEAQFISDAADLRPYVFIAHFHSSLIQSY